MDRQHVGISTLSVKCLSISITFFLYFLHSYLFVHYPLNLLAVFLVLLSLSFYQPFFRYLLWNVNFMFLLIFFIFGYILKGGILSYICHICLSYIYIYSFAMLFSIHVLLYLSQDIFLSIFFPYLPRCHFINLALYFAMLADRFMFDLLIDWFKTVINELPLTTTTLAASVCKTMTGIYLSIHPFIYPSIHWRSTNH